MDDQVGLPFVTGSDTSKAAAVEHVKHFGRQQKRLFLWSLTQRQGWADEQAQNALGMNPSSQRPRRVELVQAGLVKDSGQRRATSSGRTAVVWVAA